MAKKTPNYIILSYPTTGSLADAVTKKDEEGYVCQGGLTTSMLPGLQIKHEVQWYHQAMVHSRVLKAKGLTRF